MSYGLDLIIGAQKAEFDIASRTKSLTLKIQIGLGLLAAVSVLFNDPLVVYATLGVTGLGIVWWFSENSKYSSARSCAERLRHFIVIKGAYGQVATPPEAEALLSCCHSPSSEWERRRDPNYFTSKAAPGALRLKEMLAESAFWTKAMAGFAAREYFLLFTIVISISGVALYALIAVASQSTLMTVTRMVVTAILTLISSDFLGAALTYLGVQGELKTLLARLDALGSAPNDYDVALIFSDYNLSVEAMPLFASGLHGRYEKVLNEQYNLFLTGAR